jgi:hypothetical protein
MSVEPPVIKLGKRQRPDWPPAIRQHAEAIGVPLPEETGCVLSTRDAARSFINDHGGPKLGTVYLDARDVEIATPSFFDQLLMFWPLAQLVGASEDVRVSFELAQSHRSARRQSEGTK